MSDYEKEQDIKETLSDCVKAYEEGRAQTPGKSNCKHNDNGVYVVAIFIWKF